MSRTLVWVGFDDRALESNWTRGDHNGHTYIQVVDCITIFYINLTLLILSVL